jgi:hypothetical protein
MNVLSIEDTAEQAMELCLNSFDSDICTCRIDDWFCFFLRLPRFLSDCSRVF